MKRIKTVLIGAGYRGIGLLKLLMRIEEFEVVGVFDPSAPKPDLGNFNYYSDGIDDYRRMIIEEEPELTVIASPWQCHVEQAYFALMQNSHVAIEIKGGFFLGEYQPLIDIAEKKSLRIYPLENAVFMRENMAMMNVVKAGVLGELVAIKGGYRHDLRDLLVDEKGNLGNPNKPEGIWRSQFYVNENGDLYPTHGLAPVYLAAGIGRTDQITELTSFASKAKGLQEKIAQCNGDTEVTISTGDIVITQMRTRHGLLITLTHDTTLPRPRSLDFEIQGTRGIWRGEFRQIYVEGESPLETWEDDEKYIEQYEHKYWELWGEDALRIDLHHQGMDYIMLNAVAADLDGEIDYPILPEDLAVWTSITPYSKMSIEHKRTIMLDKEEI